MIELADQCLLVLPELAGIDVGDRLLLDVAQRCSLGGGHAHRRGHEVRPRKVAVDDLRVVQVARQRQLLEQPLDVAQGAEAALPGRGDNRIDAARGLGAPRGVAE